MFIKLVLGVAFLGFVAWRIFLERAHPGPASLFLPLWAWIALTAVSVPAALVSGLQKDGKLGKVPDNVHSAMRELQRRGQIRGFDALILWACRMFYVGMMVWCALFIYQKFGQFKLNAIYPVVVAIVLVNMAYNTVVQLVAWSAFYRKPVNIDDLYEQMPKE